MVHKEEQQVFHKELTSFRKRGLRSFPWRETHDPYQVLVSELMLQQTQTDRVVPFYTRFIKEFPTVRHLARAELKEVLILWSGLGYNRRAKFLHAAAKQVMSHYKGVMPKTYEELCTLPGVGTYTASAVMAFAYNAKAFPLETNIRTVLIHHFFPKKKQVSEEALRDALLEIAPRRNHRAWYNLLMDYGAFLKKQVGNKNTQSKTYQKQSTFKGSVREVRGKVLKLLKERAYTSIELESVLKRELATPKKRVTSVLQGLVRDGLVQKKGKLVSL